MIIHIQFSRSHIHQLALPKNFYFSKISNVVQLKGFCINHGHVTTTYINAKYNEKNIITFSECIDRDIMVTSHRKMNNRKQFFFFFGVNSDTQTILVHSLHTGTQTKLLRRKMERQKNNKQRRIKEHLHTGFEDYQIKEKGHSLH